MCLPNWHGKNCSEFCNNSSDRYTCTEEGRKVCLPGSRCASHCTEIESIRDLYLCNNVGQSTTCPYEWIQRRCSPKCIEGEGSDLRDALNQCKENSDVFQLCSQSSKDEDIGCNEDQGKRDFLL